MSSKPARRQPQYPKKRGVPTRRRRSPWLFAAGAVAVAAVAAAFVVVGRSSGPASPTKALAGAAAPAFSEQDIVTGAEVSSKGLLGRNVLLFFSEGVMCQACFVEIQALQKHAAHLKQRGLALVSITTDPDDILRKAAEAYAITTPLISDENRDMSNAYDVLGQGMHPDTAGHTFVLVDRKGTIRWRRDYQTMYVGPDRLLATVPRI